MSILSLSGTILIESAMKALNIAPGLIRRFSAELWHNFPVEVWSKERVTLHNLLEHQEKARSHEGRVFFLICDDAIA